MDIFADLLINPVVSTSTCDCHGEQTQVDAELKNGTPVRILLSVDGFHVSVGAMPERPPMPVSAKTAVEIVRRASGQILEGR